MPCQNFSTKHPGVLNVQALPITPSRLFGSFRANGNINCKLKRHLLASNTNGSALRKFVVPEAAAFGSPAVRTLFADFQDYRYGEPVGYGAVPLWLC